MHPCIAYGTLERNKFRDVATLICKKLLLDFKMFFDSPIKLNKLYGTVEKHLQKNF